MNTHPLKGLLMASSLDRPDNEVLNMLNVDLLKVLLNMLDMHLSNNNKQEGKYILCLLARALAALLRLVWVIVTASLHQWSMRTS